MRPWRPSTILLFGLAVSLLLLVRAVEAQDVPAAEPEPAAPMQLVRFADGRLTVDVSRVSLRELLDEIARQSDLTVVRYGTADREVTMEFDQVPLEQALQWILHDRSFVLQYARAARPEQLPDGVRPATLWVLSPSVADSSGSQPRVGGANVEFSSDPIATRISRVRAGLRSEDADEREDAVLALAQGGHAQAVAPLSAALADDDAGVREATIVSLAEIGGAQAVAVLGAALGDADPHIREDAVHALGEIGGDDVVVLLKRALADDDRFVREAAADMLDELAGSAR